MHIALIGCGNMGEAILAGLHKKNKFSVVELRAERRQQLKKKYRIALTDVPGAVKNADVVVLAVKPQDFLPLLDSLANCSLKNKLIISIAAGITTAYIEKALKQPVRVVRVMPNLPAVIGEGMTGLSRGKKATPADIRRAVQIFAAIGDTVVVREGMLNGLTAVSGSGPAYVFLFAECMMTAAQRLGFKEAEARLLVYKTLSGSAHMLAKSQDSAEALRQKVTSKGGTTAAAVDVFMKRNITGMFDAALKAARNRAKELSK
ncbi:MAG: pyrroline-5-carboxylate reductase [Candidatus Omnitrophica bacterium]|nr:pyrroline-5-carboxylate reductase [Candidatus Omnitrophota bacterium]